MPSDFCYSKEIGSGGTSNIVVGNGGLQVTNIPNIFLCVQQIKEIDIDFEQHEGE